MGEDSVEWPRDALEIERIDEEAGIADLAASAAAQEPPKLLLVGPAAPLRHLLERPKPTEITVGAKDCFDGRRTERPDELILQICDAHVEPKLLQVHTSEVGAKTGALECPAKHRLLFCIAQSREPRAIIPWTELVEESCDAVGASEPNNADVRRYKVHPASLGQRLDRDLVAHALNDHDRRYVGVRFHIHRRHPMHNQADQRAKEETRAAATARRLMGGTGLEPVTPSLSNPGSVRTRSFLFGEIAWLMS
jgi:hypothetical protein